MAPGVLAVLTVLQIRPGKHILHARFGTPFDDYARRVRRWL